jgi:hypothetical protein
VAVEFEGNDGEAEIDDADWWRDVGHGPNGGAHRGGQNGAGGGGFCKGKEEVVRLDVPVDDSVFVHDLEGVEHLNFIGGGGGGKKRGDGLYLPDEAKGPLHVDATLSKVTYGAHEPPQKDFRSATDGPRRSMARQKKPSDSPKWMFEGVLPLCCKTFRVTREHER